MHVRGVQTAEPPSNRITPTEAASRMVADEPGLQTVEQVQTQPCRIHPSLSQSCWCSLVEEGKCF